MARGSWCGGFSSSGCEVRRTRVVRIQRRPRNHCSIRGADLRAFMLLASLSRARRPADAASQMAVWRNGRACSASAVMGTLEEPGAVTVGAWEAGHRLRWPPFPFAKRGRAEEMKPRGAAPNSQFAEETLQQSTKERVQMIEKRFRSAMSRSCANPEVCDPEDAGYKTG